MHRLSIALPTSHTAGSLADIIARTDYEMGRLAYLTGARYPECTTPEMRDGWTACAGDCRAVAMQCVNWNSEAVR